MTDRFDERGRPGSRPTRLLRALAGVREPVLDWVPEERSRYTALGGLVLGTAVLATVSMFMAVRLVTGTFIPALLLAPIWGLFVLSLDRWLVSTAPSGQVAERLMMYAPRLLLALVTGIVIAEPLVLMVFDKEVEQSIRVDDVREQRVLESRWRYCNPIPGTTEAAAAPGTSLECRDFRLSLPDPGAAVNELSRLQSQLTSLRSEYEASSRRLQQLEDDASRECAGVSGGGLSGTAGEGPNCRRLRAEANRYRADQRLDVTASAVTKLTARIETQQTRVGTSQSEAARARDVAIRERVEELRDTSDPGLLARLGALNRLAASGDGVALTTWLLRLFIVLIDVLPALARLLMGTTAYDRILAYQVDHNVRAGNAAAHERLLSELTSLELARSSR